MDRRDINPWSIAQTQPYRATDATYSPPSMNTSASSSIDDDTRARFNAHFQSGSLNNSKSLINNSTQDEDDDETGYIIRNPIAFAEAGYQARKADQSQMYDAIHQMSALSLQNNPVNNSMYGYTSPPMSPTGNMPYTKPQYRHGSSMPPVNPADQNPPCNTIYVGNLPIDAKEDELKAMFSKCRGYKRLCFRTKQQSPLCFVEFNDTTAATRALNECHGQLLSNSGTTGVRLSFSKNPLGVRSGQVPGHGQPLSHHGYPMNVPSYSGPPPGLSAPPGLEVRRYTPSQYSNGGYYGNGGHYATTPYSDAYSGQYQFSASAARGAYGSSLDGMLATSSSSERRTSPRFNAAAQPFPAEGTMYQGGYSTGRPTVPVGRQNSGGYGRNESNTASASSSRLAIH